MLKAQEPPEVVKNRIDPKHVAAYVSCLDAQLYGFASREELLNLDAPTYRIKEVFSHQYPPESFCCTVQHDKEWVHVFLDNKFGKGMHTEQYISMEAVLSEYYQEAVEKEIHENEKNFLLLKESDCDRESEPVKETEPELRNLETPDYALNEEKLEL